MARKESRQARTARTAAVFERLAAANPLPKGELEYLNPFTLLVAVVLSAQATDAGVNKATRALFAVADTPEKMAALGEERLAERIKTVGLYRTKAKNIVALSRAIIDKHGGETPRNREALEALPGVGPFAEFLRPEIGLVLMIEGQNLNRLTERRAAEIGDRHLDPLDARGADYVRVNSGHVVDEADDDLIVGGMGRARCQKSA